MGNPKTPKQYPDRPPRKESLTKFRDRENREAIYKAMAIQIQQHTGGPRTSKPFNKALFEAIMDLIFKRAIETGSFRFPRGMGIFKLRTLKPTRRRLPNGEYMEMSKPRSILRFNEGLTVRLMLGKPDRYPNRRKPLRESLRLDDIDLAAETNDFSK